MRTWRACQHLRDDHARRSARPLGLEPSARRQPADRVYGPELMLRVCRGAAAAGIPIYLYGGRPGVTEVLELAAGRHVPRLADRRRGDAALLRLRRRKMTRSSSGLLERCPRGVHWPRLPQAGCLRIRIATGSCAVQICVGAAFDFHAGVKRMAPRWMQRWGVAVSEWLAQRTEKAGGEVLTTNSVFVWTLLFASLCRGKVRPAGADSDRNRRRWQATRRLAGQPSSRPPCPKRPKRRCGSCSIT